MHKQRGDRGLLPAVAARIQEFDLPYQGLFS
ncbi:hypothetical protein JOF28_001269 [Leucobacter exalbidus]|uniref:Uncharacterized protein n=1 Tax=Leucobacter exalbidus TaxID=662960 RepID=A0A940PSM2_9MICO|nr:hypothetical protein [Leucobacter exalbidus]